MQLNVAALCGAALKTSRRATMVVVCAAVLAACGSSSTVSSLVPTRFVAFGDGFTDLGQTGVRYTVNDGSNLWIQTVASTYGTPITTQAAGGQGWARGNARVLQKPDAAGNAATLTVKEQIDAFLASNTIGKDDVTVLNGGLSDLVALTNAFKAGTITSAQVLTDATQAGKDLGAQVRRLVNAGGEHVVVVGTYDLSRTPFATAAGANALLREASLKFNEALLVSIVDLGASALYIDAAFQYNLFINTPGNFSLTNATTAVCTVPVQTPCTTSTLVAGFDYNTSVFADSIYPTPVVHRLFGEYAYGRMKARW